MSACSARCAAKRRRTNNTNRAGWPALAGANRIKLMDKKDRQLLLDTLEIVARLEKRVSTLDSCQDDLTNAVITLLAGHDESKPRWKAVLDKNIFPRDQLDTSIRNLIARLKSLRDEPESAAG